MIIFAHAGPPTILFQMRNFDVPLMVLVSGMSFGIAFKDESYFHYLWKRVKRLIFPVWVFLTIYFISLYLYRPSADDLSLQTILSSYFLFGGIGYVWIIRVFILVAVIAPFIYLIDKNLKSNGPYLVTLFCVFISYELLRYLSMPYTKDGVGKYFSLVFFYIIPYSILFAFGLRIPKIHTKTNLIISLCSMITFIAIATFLWFLTGVVIPTQNYKYPPSIYYFSYAITVSILLWRVGDEAWKTIEKSSVSTNIITFIAQNSIWIYLWHIPLAKALHMNFVVKYFIMYTVATCITLIQMWFVKNLLTKSILSQRMKRNIKIVLTG